MAAVTVNADNTRWDTLDTDAKIVSIGGGAGASTESDFYYEGAGCISRKITGLGGFSQDDTTAINISTNRRQTLMAKVIATNKDALSSAASSGLQLWIGESTADHRRVYLETNLTYPIRGGFLIRPVDPDVAGYIGSSNGTTANIDTNSINSIGIVAAFDATAKANNLAMDALDVGAGLNLTGGDGADTDGVFQDFVDYDEGTLTNRFGYVFTNRGIVQIYGMAWIGQSTAQVAVATEFVDSDEVIIFPDGRFNAGFSGISLDLTTLSTVSFSGITLLGRGTTVNADTRPVFTVTGTTGHFESSGGTFDNFSTIELTTASTLTGCKITNSLSLVQGGAFITNCEISGAVNSTVSTAFVHSTDLGRFTGTEFIYSQGHAIVVTAPGTYSMTDVVFTDYGADGTSNAAILNKSSGNVQINVSSGTGVTYTNNGTTSLTTVTNTVTISVTVVDESGSSVSGAQVWVSTQGSTTAIINEDSASTGLASTSYNFTSTEQLTIRVRKASSGATAYLPFLGSGELTANGFSLTVRLTEDKIWSSLGA